MSSILDKIPFKQHLKLPPDEHWLSMAVLVLCLVAFATPNGAVAVAGVLASVGFLLIAYWQSGPPIYTALICFLVGMGLIVAKEFQNSGSHKARDPTDECCTAPDGFFEDGPNIPEEYPKIIVDPEGGTVRV